MAESTSNTKRARIFHARVDENARKEDKYRFLDKARSINGVEWQELEPDAKHTWLTEGMHDEFETFMPIGSRELKASKEVDVQSVFKEFGGGIKTNRDTWVYNFSKESLSINIARFIETYNAQVFKWNRRVDKMAKVDDFVVYDEKNISWSRDLKLDLQRGKSAEFSKDKLREALYRPFTKVNLFFDRTMNEEVYNFPSFFPSDNTEKENRVICVTDLGSEKPFMSLLSDRIVDLHLSSPGCSTQCFPVYTYNEDGTNRRENITDWAVAQFRAEYKDESITKLDIFHYVYALLHHPTYRTTYAANLKRELPRIPFVKSAADFRALVSAGGRLADLHVNYEAQPEYPLERVEQADTALDWRVERMRLSKDKSSIVYNDFLTLEGIPAEAFEYRLGNRSALEWIIDQYQVSTDRRSGITNDPNRTDDPAYIVKLIGKVTTVSLETVKIVRAFPELRLT
jgi:predicted helicase